MTAPHLRLRGVSRHHRVDDQEIHALRGIDLDIRQGEMIALVGASGSGKSTLLNILGFLDRPSSGDYFFNGSNTIGSDPSCLAGYRCDHFGFVFQRYHLLPHLTSRENVEIPAIYAGVARSRRQRRAIDLLTKLGLAEKVERRPAQLSGGQQQRVSIARALMNGGEIILADEPTGALDRNTGRETLELFRELNALGHTLVIATHDPEVAAFASRIIELDDGRIVGERMQHRRAFQTERTQTTVGTRESKRRSIGVGSQISEALRMAWSSLLVHRTRTALSLLGIIIGILSVTTMVAVGEAAQRKIRNELKGIPGNYLAVMPGKFMGDPESVETLTALDADILKSQPFVASLSPVVQTSSTMRLGSKSSLVTVDGVGEQYFATNGFRFESGRGFGVSDVEAQRQIAVIDTNAVKHFFASANPLGSTIQIAGIPCLVVGVVGKNLAIEGAGSKNQPVVYLPYTTVNARISGQAYLNWIDLRFKAASDEAGVIANIERMLERRHHAKDFFVFSFTERIRARHAFTDTMTYLLATISVVSLVVGGIGVMNIMLVSVLERTTEIGLRLAVGARARDIQIQFLIEAVLVCAIGACVGVILSFIVAYSASEYFAPDWRLALSPSAVLAAVVSAVLTGVVFGYFPARNAARLDPVEALARD